MSTHTCPRCNAPIQTGQVQCANCGLGLDPASIATFAAQRGGFTPGGAVSAPPVVSPPAPVRKAGGRRWLIGLVGLLVLCGVISAVSRPAPTPNGSGTVATAAFAASPTVGEIVAAVPPTLAPSTAALPTVRAATATSLPVPTVPAAPTALPKVGDTVLVGSWQVQVEKVQTAKEITWSDYGNKDAAKGQFVLVYATVKNITNKSAAVNSFDYKLLDSTGAEYDTTSSIAAYSYPKLVKRISFNEQIPPRTTSALLGIFDVATDATDLVLQIENSTKIVLGTPGPLKR